MHVEKTQNNVVANRKYKRKKVKYVKQHIINSTELDSLIYGKNKSDKANINRNVLVWYVVGHWRQIKNGKKIFVKPHWKGLLREIKMALPEREREIAQLLEV